MKTRTKIQLANKYSLCRGKINLTHRDTRLASPMSSLITPCRPNRKSRLMRRIMCLDPMDFRPGASVFQSTPSPRNAQRNLPLRDFRLRLTALHSGIFRMRFAPIQRYVNCRHSTPLFSRLSNSCLQAGYANDTFIRLFRVAATVTI